jgi:alkaline phosphatase D
MNDRKLGQGASEGEVSSAAIGRRDALLGAAGLALAVPFAAPLAGCSSSDAPPSERFKHGIASGDPLPDAVILWTRVTGDGAAPVDVEWEVADDPAMTKRVAAGSFKTDAERDFTVKVDVKGLAPGRAYYYRFRALGAASKVGRTRTAPAGPTPRLRFAMMSCASFAHGYFHAYKAVAAQADLDCVVHLGDYIYEYESGGYGSVRDYEPANEILTLADYRARHAQYKRDPDLQEVHRQHPFITVWDDHEVANDGYKDGAENHKPEEGAWPDRKAAGLRAYREWMPIREQADGRIFRKLAFGDLVDLVMLDTRYWGRTKQSGTLIAPVPAPDPARTLLGDDQAAWLEDALKTSGARWKLLGQQVMLANLVFEGGRDAINLDQWHGYPESRTRFISFMRSSGVKNVVVLTGDIHSSWANEIVLNPNDKAEYDPATGRGSVAVEIVTPGVTSPGIPPVALGIVDGSKPFNPHIRWYDLTRRGFVILDVTPDRLQAAWYHMQDVEARDYAAPAFAGAWSVKNGETRLNQDPAAAPAREGAPAAAT